MESAPVATFKVHEYLRPKVCKIGEMGIEHETKLIDMCVCVMV